MHCTAPYRQESCSAAFKGCRLMNHFGKLTLKSQIDRRKAQQCHNLYVSKNKLTTASQRETVLLRCKTEKYIYLFLHPTKCKDNYCLALRRLAVKTQLCLQHTVHQTLHKAGSQTVLAQFMHFMLYTVADNEKERLQFAAEQSLRRLIKWTHFIVRFHRTTIKIPTETVMNAFTQMHNLLFMPIVSMYLFL